MTVRILAVAVTILAGCTTTPEVPTQSPGCPGACTQLATLECPEAEPSPLHGVTCLESCEVYHDLGYLRPWADCVAASGDVDAVRACGVRCER